MGLLNYFQKQKNRQEEKPATEVLTTNANDLVNSSGDDSGPLITDKDWAACEAKAPARSQTTPEMVRLALADYLVFDPVESVLGVKALLMSWGISGTVGLGICKSCREVMVLVGDVAVSIPAACAKCGKPVVQHRLIYSKEVGNAVREFLQGHERCTKALKSAQEALITRHDPEESERLLKELQAIAEEISHGGAKGEATRWGLLLRAFKAKTNVEQAIREVWQLSKTAPSPAGQGEQDAALNLKRLFASMLLTARLQELTKLGHEAADAGFPAVAIDCYWSSVQFRDVLLKSNSENRELLFAQSCDLDELGCVLRDNEPARRQEALGHVRRAAEIMESLDRMDPDGRNGRAPQLSEIRAHLHGPW